MLSRHCPLCGKTEGEERFVGSFCKECFLASRALYRLPELTLSYCTRCERFRLGGVWKPASQLGEFLRQKLKSDYDIKFASAKPSIGNKEVTCLLHVELEVDGSAIETDERVRFPLDKHQCETCSLKAGGYHEAVLQVRGSPTRVRQKAESLMRNLEKETFIARITEQKNGVDILVGKKRPLLELVQGEHYTSSNKLVGQKEGKRLYRITVCLRV